MDAKKNIFSIDRFCTLSGQRLCCQWNDFNIDSNYKSVYNGKYYSVYANGNQDSGISIYKNVNDDVYDDVDNDDVFDGIIHHDGREYLHADDDLAINVGADHIGNFTDYDHATHGVSEVVNAGGEQFIVVVWTKNTSNMDNAKLLATLNDFNKNNNVNAVAF